MAVSNIHQGRPGELRRLLSALRDPVGFGWLAAAFGLVGVGGLAAGLAPLALKHIVQSLDGSEGRRPVAAVLAYLAALAAQRLCEQAQAYALGRGEQRLVRRLSARAFVHLLGLPMRFHLGASGGALAQAVADAGLGLRVILTHLVASLAPALVQLSVAVVVLATALGVAGGLGLAAIFTGYAVVFAWGVARQSRLLKAISEAHLQAAAIAADGLLNVEALKTSTAEPRFAARYEAALARREQRWRAFLSRRLAHGLAVAALFAAGYGAALWLATGAVSQGRLSLANFVLLTAYLLQLMRPLEMVGVAARDVQQGRAYLAALAGILAEPREAGPVAPYALAATAGAAGSAGVSGAAKLSFEAVRFAYGPGRAAIGPLSFRAPPGAFLAVVGPSGSGKSTLLRLIVRLLEPDAGVIRLDGRPIGELPLAALRAQVALVPQDALLVNGSLAENIALGVEFAGEAELYAAAEAARLGELIARLPAGLATPVGERGLRLSGGERQRIVLARAGLRRARLVLLDEATAALDAVTERAAWAAVRQMGRAATVIAATHRLSAAAEADAILVMDRGRIVERGRHRQLLRRGGMYARLWAAQGAGARPGDGTTT